MKLLLTTQSYCRDVATPYGLLLEMDTGSGRVLRQLRIETPVDSVVPGERLKPGLRGICRFRRRLYVCTWNRVCIVDEDTFQVTAELSHPWMSDLHGIHVNEDGLWLTSSLPDALLLYDFDGNPQASFWAPGSSLYASPVSVDRDMDWRWRGKGFRGFKQFHANHVTVKGDTVYLTGRGLAVTGTALFVGQSTWAGDSQARARVVHMDSRTLAIRDIFYLDIPDYPETRIFQIYI